MGGPRKFEALLPRSEIESEREGEERLDNSRGLQKHFDWRLLTLRGVHRALCFKTQEVVVETIINVDTTLALGLLGGEKSRYPHPMYLKTKCHTPQRPNQ